MSKRKPKDISLLKRGKPNSPLEMKPISIQSTLGSLGDV